MKEKKRKREECEIKRGKVACEKGADRWFPRDNRLVKHLHLATDDESRQWYPRRKRYIILWGSGCGSTLSLIFLPRPLEATKRHTLIAPREFCRAIKVGFIVIRIETDYFSLSFYPSRFAYPIVDANPFCRGETRGIRGIRETQLHELYSPGVSRF